MGADLYHAQCLETLDRPATATARPQRGAAGIGQKPEGGAESQGVVEDRQAIRLQLCKYWINGKDLAALSSMSNRLRA